MVRVGQCATQSNRISPDELNPAKVIMVKVHNILLPLFNHSELDICNSYIFENHGVYRAVMIFYRVS